jgi:hypothetical protein
MDFFTELLESFSRKHNRKLRLLEQEEDDAQALAAAKQLAAQAPKGTFNQPITTQAPSGRTIGVFMNKKNELKGGIVGQDGRVLGRAHTKNIKPASKRNKSFMEFVGLFKSEGDSQTQKFKSEMTPEEIEQMERDLRRRTLDQSNMAKNYPKVVEALKANMDTLEQSVKELICDENGNTKPEYFRQVMSSLEDPRSPAWQKCSTHLNFIVGNTRGNIETSLVKNNNILKFNPATERYYIEERDPAPDESLSVSKALDLLSQAAKPGASDEVKEDACRRFMAVEGPSRDLKDGINIFTDPHSRDNGRVILQKSAVRTITAMMQLAGCDTTKQPMRKALIAGSAGRESNTRGEIGERSKIITNLVFSLNSALAAGASEEDVADLRDIISDHLVDFGEMIRSLNAERETWLDRAQEEVPTAEEVAGIQTLSEFVEDPDKREYYAKALFIMSRVTTSIRKPLVAVQVAEQVGEGDKQDVLECWDSPEKALEGLRRAESFNDGGDSRITEDDITSATVEEIYSNRPDELKALIKAKILKKGQILYSSEVSLKSQLSKGPAKMGQAGHQRTNESLLETGATPDPRATRFYDRLDDPSYKEGIQALQRTAESIKTAADNLNVETLVRTEDGMVSQQSMRTAVDSIVNYVTRNSTFSEINNDTAIASLRDDLESLISGDPSISTESFQAKVREKIYRTTLFTQVTNKALEVKADGTPTKRARTSRLYAMALMNQAGGSKSDSTIFQVDVLNELKSFVSTQNGELNAAMDSIMSGDGKWEFQGTGGSLVMYRTGSRQEAGGSNRRLTLTYKEGKYFLERSQTSISFASNEFSASEAASKALTPDIRQDDSVLWNALGKLQEALGIIKEKVRVLDTQ